MLLELHTRLQQFRKESRKTHLLPSASQILQLGTALHSLSLTSGVQSQYSNVQVAYDALLQALPVAYNKQLFEDLTLSAANVLLVRRMDQDQDHGDATLSALQSIVQLFESSATAQSFMCDAWSKDGLSALLEQYSKDNKLQINEVSAERLCILKICRLYLRNARDLDALLTVLFLFQQDAVFWSTLVTHLNANKPVNYRWKDEILRHFTDEEESQQAYLSSLLDATKQSDDQDLAERVKRAAKIFDERTAANSNSKPKPVVSTKVSPEQEIQRRVDQVRAVLPQLGEGFVEIALSCWKADIEATIAHLLDPTESQWPSTLKATDRNLPKRHDKNNVSAAAEAEAKAIAKATLQAVGRQAEYEAQIIDAVMSREEEEEKKKSRVQNSRHNHDEYDDDYDDQYDDMEGVGNADGGLYDDYEAIRIYNRTLKQVVAEQDYWEQSKSTNRSPNSQDPDSRNSSIGENASQHSAKQTTFRGPDKMRGGRLPGHGAGGRGRSSGRSNGGGRTDTPSGNANRNGANNAQHNVPGAEKKPPSSDPNKSGDNKPNLRQKDRNLSKRRDQQKKAAVQRTGT